MNGLSPSLPVAPEVTRTHRDHRLELGVWHDDETMGNNFPAGKLLRPL